MSTETSSSSNGSSRQQRKRGGTDEPRVAGVRLTSPDRVLYPDQGITKRALAEFYAEIADWVLPHVTERPLALVRCPEGRKKECFFQKHFRESMPDQLEAVSVPEKKGKADYVMIRDLAGLIALVQMGVLEIHPWGSRADRPDRPDLITFDLDPGENVSWADVVAAARHVHARLNEYELTNFLKTSGGKGLHVIVPITRRSSWDEVRSFASRVAHEIAEADPERFVATMSKAKRKGKVFIDYLRNGQGATSVAAYSTRARTGAPVSTPLRWDELSPDVQADAYTVETLPQRLSRLKSDPWQDFNDVRQAIRKSMLED